MVVMRFKIQESGRDFPGSAVIVVCKRPTSAVLLVIERGSDYFVAGFLLHLFVSNGCRGLAHGAGDMT
jgi:hypothetical protein